MRHFITIVLLILLPLCAKADNSQLYKQLDAAIEKRAHYVEVKEKSLNDIKQGAKYVTSTRTSSSFTSNLPMDTKPTSMIRR